MMKQTKRIVGYLALALSLFLLALPFISPSNLLVTSLGVGVAVLAAFVWGTEGGIIVMFFLASIILSMFFKSPEIMLFGFSAAIITMAITFRLKLTLRNLRKSERKYRSIVNNVSGAVYSQSADDKRKPVFLSERFEEVTSYSPDIFLSGKKKIHDMVHPRDWARIKRTIEGKIKSNGFWDLEYRIIGSENETRWVNERGRMVLSDEGEFLMEGIIIDITDRKEMEEALKDSEEKYRNLVERANDGIVIVQEGKIKYVNPKITQMLGYDKSNLTETDFEDYVAEEEKIKFLRRYEKTGEGDMPAVYETVLRNISGRKISVEMNSGFINYEGGLADLLIVRDVTQRKQIEEIVHQREQEFRNLVERAPDIIARIDVGHRYVYVNPAIKRETGMHPRDLFWKTPREAGLPEDIVRVWEEALDTVFETKKEKAIYTEQITPAGKKYYYTRLLPEYSKDGRVRTVLAISRDITEAKEIDKVKSEFISVSSHQLRTPLSVIRWCTVMFLDGMLGEITKEQRSYLEKIYGSTRKLIKISNAFFNAAILDLGILSVIPKKIDLIEVAEESVKDIDQESKERGIKISKDYDNNLPTIKADKRLLHTIFKGLLSNAVKYGYSGGNVWLTIKKHDNDILVKISDDGRGIPEKEQPKIFTKFFRADNIKGEEIYGTGLDLYIIKEIITNFGGTIWFESPNSDIGKKSRKGTAFYFTIPLSGMKKREGEKGLTD